VIDRPQVSDNATGTKMVPPGTDCRQRHFPDEIHGVGDDGNTQIGFAQEACKQDIHEAQEFSTRTPNDIQTRAKKTRAKALVATRDPRKRRA
jgi:hypothetical protein